MLRGGEWELVKQRILSGRDPFNQNSNRSDRENWSTSKGGPVFSKLFRLDRTDPLSFGPKFPEILVEWIAPAFVRDHVRAATDQGHTSLVKYAKRRRLSQGY